MAVTLAKQCDFQALQLARMNCLIFAFHSLIYYGKQSSLRPVEARNGAEHARSIYTFFGDCVSLVSLCQPCTVSVAVRRGNGRDRVPQARCR